MFPSHASLGLPDLSVAARQSNLESELQPSSRDHVGGLHEPLDKLHHIRPRLHCRYLPINLHWCLGCPCLVGALNVAPVLVYHGFSTFSIRYIHPGSLSLLVGIRAVFDVATSPAISHIHDVASTCIFINLTYPPLARTDLS